MRGLQLDKLAAPFSVFFGSALGLLTTLVAPRLLAPAEYITFATLLSTGQLIATAGFEWLKQCVLRFGNSSADGLHPGADRVRVLNGGYTLVATFLLASAAIFAMASLASETMRLCAAALMYAVSQGLFDGIQAWARWHLRNVRFALLWLVRAGVSLLVAVVVALSTRSGILCVIGISTSMFTCIALACVGRGRLRQAVLPLRQAVNLYPYLKFGVLAALTTSLTAAMQPLFRNVSALMLGANEAAGAIFAVDIAFKVISIVGLAVNVLVSQHTYRRIDAAGPELKSVLEKIQFAFPLLLLVPTACLFYLAQPAAVAIMVPASIRAGYTEAIAYADVGALALSIRLFCVDPLFLMARKACLALLGPSVTLALLACAVVWANLFLDEVSPRQLSGWYCGSSVAGLLVSIYTARRKIGIALPWRQLMAAFMAATAMMCVGWMIGANGYIGNAIAIAVAVITYAGLVLLSSASATRNWLRSYNSEQAQLGARGL